MTFTDLIIFLAVVGAIVFLVYRKRKQKKAQAENTENGTVQASELDTTAFPASPLLTGNSFSGGSFFTYPKGSQVDITTFNFREYTDMLSLSNAIEARINRLLMEVTNQDHTPMFHYIVVGTTLVVVCVFPL